MENEEKIMTDQDIIQEKNSNIEPASRTLQATQVVDADQGANVHDGPHDAQLVDADQGANVHAESEASQIVAAQPHTDTDTDTDTDTQPAQHAATQATTATDTQPVHESDTQSEVGIQPQDSQDTTKQAAAATDAQPAHESDTQSEADIQPQDSQIVDAQPEAETRPENAQIVDAQPEAETRPENAQIVDAQPVQPEGDVQTPASQIVEADQTPQETEQESRSEADIPTVSFNAKSLKNHTEKLLSKIKPAKGRQSTSIVTADSVQAEEVPTIPIGSLQSLSALEPEVSVHSVASMRAVGMPAPLVAQSSEYRRGLGEWIEIWRDGIRPGYLPLSLMPILLGSALAWTQTITSKHLVGHFDVIPFVLALVAAIILQTGAHLINDYYDYQRGIDTSNVLGPGGLLQQGLIKPTRILTIGLVFLAIGSAFGLGAAFKGGALACLFGLIIVFCAYFFSATKKALSSLGLGELIGFLAFGVLPTLGAYMIQTRGILTSQVFAYSLPLGFLAAATIYANNMRDIEGDSHVGKRTLATILGLRFSRIAYSILMIAAYVIVFALGAPHAHPHFILIALWTIPSLVVAITGAMRTEISAGFHGVMRQTLKIYTLFTVLLIIGLILAAIIPALPKIPTNLITIP